MKRYTLLLFTLWLLPLTAFAESKTGLGLTATAKVPSVPYVLFMLFTIVALIFLLAFFVKRFGHFKSTSQSTMKSIGSLSVGNREKIVLVEIGKTQMLIGVAPGNVRHLHVFDEPVVDQNTVKSDESFASRLHLALNRGLQK